EMTLLRMLAFRPVEGVGTTPTKTSSATTPAAKPVTAKTPVSRPAAPSVAQAAPPPTVQAAPVPVSAPKSATTITNWNETAAQLKVSGFVRELASNTTLESYDNGALALVLAEACAGLLNKDRESELRQALEAHLGSPVRLSVRVGKANGETLAKERSRMQDEKQQAAVQAIQEDPNVRAMQERFGARVNPNSIRPKA
ncbi:MAG TPA: DNA polymerase III subunit gamma/tau C-terminal domain-containing protein, partial [Burkholderiales bacterium]|nr:DNA polymerase III subunit gamma/tau C-terminal domain-containing protein [Burkholderiales bacterium]